MELFSILFGIWIGIIVLEYWANRDFIKETTGIKLAINEIIDTVNNHADNQLEFDSRLRDLEKNEQS